MVNWHRIDHVQLRVPPTEEAKARAAAFYRDVLGFAPLEKPPSLDGTDSFWFQRGGVEIHLGPEAGDERSRRHPAFEVSDLDALRTHLEGVGVEISDEPPIPGRDRFSFRDPFGNRIELLEYDD